MALKMENVITSFVIMGGLVFFFTMFYNGLDSEYSFDTEQDDIATQINNLNLMTGFNNLTTGLHQLSTPNSIYDIIGGLKTSGIGFLKVSTGVVTFPIRIFGIYTGFFSLPSEFETILGTLIIIYIGFLVLNLYIDR